MFFILFLRFLVQGVFPAPLTEFLQLQLLVQCFWLFSEIINPFALLTLKFD